VSLRDVNSLTCIALYSFSGGLQAPFPDPSPLDGNTVTVAAKCYEDNCHYRNERMYTIICSSALQWTLQNVAC